VLPRETADDGCVRHFASDRDLSEFLLRACHDLKTSVRAIRAHAELLRKGTQEPGISDFETRLGFIADGAGRIDLLADGLSRFSIALQIDQASFHLTRLDVVLRTVLAKLDRELRSYGAEVISGELPRISGDPDRLADVFEALIRNALRNHAEAPPRIHITAEEREQEWRLAVQDNGAGIEAAYLERIFTPFERLHTTGRDGAGLGLAICRVIVERHGGSLWAESKRGAGSTFFFTLPAVT
jgi:light-regulated signal transduction histidine kinase (bacteriophytochrome)